MWEGRTIEQKKKLVDGITSAMMEIGVSRDAIHVIIKDIPKYNWAIGGKLASEVSPEA